MIKVFSTFVIVTDRVIPVSTPTPTPRSPEITYYGVSHPTTEKSAEGFVEKYDLTMETAQNMFDVYKRKFDDQKYDFTRLMTSFTTHVTVKSVKITPKPFVSASTKVGVNAEFSLKLYDNTEEFDTFQNSDRLHQRPTQGIVLEFKTPIPPMYDFLVHRVILRGLCLFYSS